MQKIEHPGEGVFPRIAALGRQYFLPLYAVLAVLLGVAVEGLLIAPIAFFSHYLGFWMGMAAFCATWLTLGLLVLAITVRFWPERAVAAASEEMETGPVRARIARLARRSRPLGALAIAWFFGPIMSPPFFRALGYRNESLLAWVVISAPVFCIFWFSFYGGGLQLLTGLFK